MAIQTRDVFFANDKNIVEQIKKRILNIPNMKSNKHILIVFFIGMLLSNSCSGDSFVEDIDIQFCGKCAGTGKWTVNVMDFNPCFSSNAACLDWAKKNGYPDKECVLCK